MSRSKSRSPRKSKRSKRSRSRSRSRDRERRHKERKSSRSPRRKSAKSEKREKSDREERHERADRNERSGRRDLSPKDRSPRRDRSSSDRSPRKDRSSADKSPRKDRSSADKSPRKERSSSDKSPRKDRSSRDRSSSKERRSRDKSPSKERSPRDESPSKERSPRDDSPNKERSPRDDSPNKEKSSRDKSPRDRSNSPQEERRDRVDKSLQDGEKDQNDRSPREDLNDDHDGSPRKKRDRHDRSPHDDRKERRDRSPRDDRRDRRDRSPRDDRRDRRDRSPRDDRRDRSDRSPRDDRRDRRDRSPRDDRRDRRDRSPRDDRRDRRDRSPRDDRRDRHDRKDRHDRSPRNERREKKDKHDKYDERSETIEKVNEVKEEAVPKKEPVMDLRTRAGGAYIPPAKLKMMQEKIADKGGEEYQRMNWERLKKKIHGLINKVNTSNLVPVVRELLQENVFRGQGLIVRSIMQAQAFSPVFSNIYAALVAVINSKFPNIGDLLVRRLIIQFKRSFVRNDKGTAVIITKFIAHLINQNVLNEVVALEIIFLMLHNPTDDSVEVAIALLKECGARLLQVCKKALNVVFDRLRAILQDVSKEGSGLDKRVEYMIHAVMAIRKENFVAYPAVIDELDLIDEKDQIGHVKSIDDTMDAENLLNVFKFDPEFEKNEAEYDEIRKNVIGDAEDSDEDDEDDDDEGGDGNDGAGDDQATTEIIDKTELNLAAFRRKIYLTIQSSLDYQEACHKILKIGISEDMEAELCHMLVDCCTQERTYNRFYGLLCERFCRLKAEYQNAFEQITRDTYATVHRFEITKLRNISKLISHLLYTDAVSWMVFSDIKMTEEDTTSSGRIYVKYIFQELVEHMGIVKLYSRLNDPTLQTAFAGLFPRDNPQHTRFAINFFSLIGLGALTLDLRKFLEKGMKAKKEKEGENSSSDSSDSDSSDSSDSDSSDSDTSDSSSSDSSDSSDSDSDSSDSSDSD